MNDFQRLNEELLSTNFVQKILPNGKRKSNEWVALNPKRNDKNIGSFKIILKTGFWADFATGDKGGDLISLYAYVFNCSQGEALKRIKKGV